MRARTLVLLGFVCVALGCRRAPEPFPPRPRETPSMIVASEDVRLGAWTRGEGAATLLVVNGGPGASHECAGRLASLASKTRRVVLYDQRGVGESSAPSDPSRYALEDYARDLESVRKATGAEKVHVLGHSFGALVAMAYAAAYPERVASVVLVSPKAPDAATDDAANEAFERRVESLARAGAIHEPPATEGDDCRAQSAAFLPALFADPAFAPPRDEMVRTACSARVQAATTARKGRYDLRPGLARVAAPAIVLVGEGDPFGDAPARAALRALAAANPEYATLPACGHFPWVECEAPFRAHLERFLAAAGAP